jgi:uncharacterized protein (DUF885 family)
MLSKFLSTATPHTRVKLFLLLPICIMIVCAGCMNTPSSQSIAKNQPLHDLFSQYWDQRMALLPIEATAVGDNRFNHLLPAVFTASYQQKLNTFYSEFLRKAKAITTPLNEEDALSKELFEYELQNNLEALQFRSNYMPINQFWSFTLEFPQLGSGDGNQPFKSTTDYDNFLQRMKAFPAWTDSAIQYMKLGIANGYTLPKKIAIKVIPQLRDMVTSDPKQSIFFNPIRKFPESFSSEEKKRIENAYIFQISSSIIPSYNKLKTFFEKEYVPQCRTSDGISSLPDGLNYYAFLSKNFTTTKLSADSIYNLGLAQVALLRSEMEKVKTSVGFTGSLSEFFQHVNKDPSFYIFTTEKQVIDSFWSVKNTITPKLKTYFNLEPKTKFEIRQTEAYRAASASAEYNPGTEDGSRPGIFYTPILDPKKFNAVGMETLFLHEAIPGHHYQISLQQENKTLPQFRKFLGYSAYAEGWALYTETLGKELGVYQNPYQYLGHLSDAMHRAIRLVVDAGIHTKGLTREQAIGYMMSNERITEGEAIAEIERYMAIPGQALSYKIGQLSILALRAKYEKELGAKFNLASFHTAVLDGGNMPIEVLEKKLARWAKSL